MITWNGWSVTYAPAYGQSIAHWRVTHEDGSSMPFPTQAAAEAHLALMKMHDGNTTGTHYCLTCCKVLIPKSVAHCPSCKQPQLPSFDALVEHNKAAAKKAGMSGPWPCATIGCGKNVWNKGAVCDACTIYCANHVYGGTGNEGCNNKVEHKGGVCDECAPPLSYPEIPVELTREEKKLCKTGQKIAAIKAVRLRFKGPYKKLSASSHSLKSMLSNAFVDPQTGTKPDYADLTNAMNPHGGPLTLLDAKDSVDAFIATIGPKCQSQFANCTLYVDVINGHCPNCKKYLLHSCDACGKVAAKDGHTHCPSCEAFQTEAEPYPTIPVELTAEEKQLAKNGDLIFAVKKVRLRFKHVGMGLKDAKDSVDAYLKTLPLTTPGGSTAMKYAPETKVVLDYSAETKSWPQVRTFGRMSFRIHKTGYWCIVRDYGTEGGEHGTIVCAFAPPGIPKENDLCLMLVTLNASC